MRTLIIPCLGRKMIHGIPQYLLRHPSGNLLVERCFEGIFPESYDRILVAVLQSDIEKYNADTIIKASVNEELPLEVISLPVMTSGPAETVYNVLNMKKITGAVVVKDSDNYLKLDKRVDGNFVAGLDLNEWDRDIHNLRNKSFLIINEQKNILDIAEKQIRSDVISLGMYGFSKAEHFVKAYERLSDGTYPISRLYVSHIISYLIGYSGKVFRYTAASAYENWGDERLWQDMQRDYTLYFVDLDHVFTETGELLNGASEKLHALQSRGASFVGYTTRKKSKAAECQMLNDVGLQFIDVVYDCPYSEEKQIICSMTDLQQKAMLL